MTASELKTWRRKNKLSQAGLAKALHVDVMTVSRWERKLSQIPYCVDLALREIARSQKT